MKGELKYYKRAGVYKNSTGSNKFNPETLEAHSYDWWKYVAKIEGKVVFNNHSYSVTTSGHQSAMRSLLSRLNICIDYFVDAPRGLDHLELALKQERDNLQEAISKKNRARKEGRRHMWMCEQNRANRAVEFLQLLVRQEASL